MSTLRVLQSLVTPSIITPNSHFAAHSLGSGIASLAYARMMQNVDGLDPRVRICDAYMFSSPVTADMDSAKRNAQTHII